MTESRRLLQHFLAALAYRTQKALRDAPAWYADFRPSPTARTPHELVQHMTSVIGYARTMFHGGTYTPPWLPSFDDQVTHFHEILRSLSGDFANASLAASITDEQFLHGPLSDAMTHAGQLAYIRRLAGSPVAPENFIHATIRADNVGRDQAQPAAPDPGWSPDHAPRPPGRPR